MSKAKLERLLNLMALLIETPRPLGADEIHRRLAGYPDSDDAFHVAFERDKRELRSLGIPLTVEQIPGSPTRAEGYRIRKEDYYLSDPALTAEELTALHLAAAAVRVEGAQTEDGLVKLEGATGLDGPGEGGSGAAPLAALPGRSDLGDVFGAVTERRPVRFRYNGTDRTVDPYRLDFTRGRWYLRGFDHARDDERLYRMDRVEGKVKVLDEPPFERPQAAGPAGPAEPWELGGGEPLWARLLVDPDQAPWVAGYLGDQAVTERRPDGSVVVELPVTNFDNFRSFALIFLDHAEVLEPPELRRALVQWLTELADTEAPGSDGIPAGAGPGSGGGDRR